MDSSDVVSKVYSEAVVVDGLNVSNWESPAVFDSLSNGGVTAINATIAVWEGYAEAMDNVAAWIRRFGERRANLSQITGVQDILDAKHNGKTGVILGWQNASPVENDLDRLDLFYRLGVRVIQLTYNERNLLGNGCWERNDDGLSHFGADAVREMNRLGILIDLSHVGDRTTLDAIEMSDQPVACTHANARSFFDNQRNKTDDALRLIAEKGGVIGATSWPPFLRNGWESTLEDFADAIEDMVERVGIDHVGIGSDYTQGQTKEWFDVLLSQQGTKPLERRKDYPDVPGHPEGLETPDKLPAIADSLLGRGFTSDDITKILGGNWLRLLNQVWR
ncbi:MAG: dipeptidase [SAR202 cluster bacterium]|jgi:membrane dipeptidase|nr:dipeptidase [SAR202 cluster bacterium]